MKIHIDTGLEIIPRLAPVKLSSHIYSCSDTTSFWPDKYPLRTLMQDQDKLLKSIGVTVKLSEPINLSK